MSTDNKKQSIFTKVSDTNLLLAITIAIFFLMYIGAIIFQGGGFTKPQMFFNILNANAALIITSCGMSIVMISGGIDISVGGVVALVSMCCAVHLDQHGGSVFGSMLTHPRRARRRLRSSALPDPGRRSVPRCCSVSGSTCR